MQKSSSGAANGAARRAARGAPAPPPEPQRKIYSPRVYWRSEHRRWQARLYRDGRCVYLGEFADEDKDLAEAMADEALTTPDEDMKALKAKYRALRAARGISDQR